MTTNKNAFWLNNKNRLSIPVTLFGFAAMTVCLFFINAFVLALPESQSVMGSYRILMSALFGVGALIYMGFFLLLERVVFDAVAPNLLMWQRRLITFFILDLAFAYFLHRPTTNSSSLSYLEYYWRIHSNLSALIIWYVPQAAYMIAAAVFEPSSRQQPSTSADVLDDL